MKRCERCGCFFIGDNNVCYNCIPYDNSDKAKLAEYCNESVNISYEDILYSTGIASANLNRFLSSPDYSKILKQIKNRSCEHNG